MPHDVIAAQKLKTALVADLFCGAGGTSEGTKRALAALGLQMKLVALNHWDQAIRTHSINHPTARHYVEDVNTANPTQLVPEGRLDLLTASPSCVFHSRARGGKPIHDQGRMDMWAIVRWCTELRVKRLLVENVPEFVECGPIDTRTGRPIKSRKGEYFQAWVAALKAIGMTKITWGFYNSANFGDATTRTRFMLMARSDGRRLDQPFASHSQRGQASLFGEGGLPWRAAREIIDWSIPGTSIFNRKRGLAPKTLDRILAGAVKFHWPPELVEAIRLELMRQLPIVMIRCQQTLADRKTKADRRKAAQRTADWCVERLAKLAGEIGEPIQFDAESSMDPMLVMLRQHGEGRDLGKPLPAATASGTHHGLAEPIVLPSFDDWIAKTKSLGGSREEYDRIRRSFTLSTGANGAPRSVSQPLSTITTGGAGSPDPGCARPAVVDGFVLSRHGENGGVRAHPITDPLPTADCRGAGYLTEAVMINMKGKSTARSVDNPTPTITAGVRHLGLAEAFTFPANQGLDRTRGLRSVKAPLQTITATGTDLAIATPFVATVAHGPDGPDGRRCRSADEPLQTTHAGGGKFGVVDGFLCGNRTNNTAYPSSDPVGGITTTTGGGQFLTEGFILSQASGGAPRDVAEPIPTLTTGGAGGSHALIVPYYGSGSGLTCKSAAEPLDTLTAKGRLGLVVPVTHTSDGGRAVRGTGQPLPTLTTAKGGELALVMPVTHGDDAGRVRDASDPLPTITGAHRGELAFIVGAFGEREGQAPRVHDVALPMPVICATGRIQLASGLVAGEHFDVRFRMLDPKRELARAMSFSDVDIEYEFIGTKTEITKMIGNAVPVRMAAAFVTALFRN